MDNSQQQAIGLEREACRNKVVAGETSPLDWRHREPSPELLTLYARRNHHQEKGKPRMPQPFYFNFIDGYLVRMRGLRASRLLQAGSPPLALPPMNSRFVLPPEASSCEPVAHPELPYLDGSRFEVGQRLGSGIDKVAYELTDEEGNARTDVVLKVARFENHCDDSEQCRNEIDLWSWLISVEHPMRGLFAEVVAIVENVMVSDLGEQDNRTCYLCEYVKKREVESVKMKRVKSTLMAYFGVYDLHRNNLGMTADGRHVVLDYGLGTGLNKVKRDWAEACATLGDDATPQKVLAEIEPINTLKSETGEDAIWCSSCDTEVSYSHCRCTCCHRERIGGDPCYDCNTITNEAERLSESCDRVRCYTCLVLARENRRPSQCHPEGSTVWRMHASCPCDECRNARAHHDAARVENARLYENVRVSVHRLESAPPLKPIKDIRGKS